MSEEQPTGKVVPAVLVLVPALLLLSAAAAVWWHWRSETTDDPHPGLALGASDLDDDELRDTLKKLTEYIGPRDWETPEGRASMRRAIAFLSGTLSPRNYGYVVRSGGALALAGERWPTVWVDAPGSGPGVVLVAVPYDGDPGGMAAVLALAGELRDAALRRTVRFAFYPSGLWTGMGGSKASVLGAADAVLCVGRLGPGRDLWLVGPVPEAGGAFPNEVLDGHAADAELRKEALHFMKSSIRVWEIRGGPENAKDGAGAASGSIAEGLRAGDLRARVGRLEKILRALANSE